MVRHGTIMTKLNPGGITVIESNNQIVSTITYNTVERIMGWYDQKTKRTVHNIHLYTDTISTANNIFKLEHVHDMSYKPFSSGAAFSICIQPKVSSHMKSRQTQPISFGHIKIYVDRSYSFKKNV